MAAELVTVVGETDPDEAVLNTLGSEFSNLKDRLQTPLSITVEHLYGTQTSKVNLEHVAVTIPGIFPVDGCPFTYSLLYYSLNNFSWRDLREGDSFYAQLQAAAEQAALLVTDIDRLPLGGPKEMLRNSTTPLVSIFRKTNIEGGFEVTEAPDIMKLFKTGRDLPHSVTERLFGTEVVGPRSGLGVLPKAFQLFTGLKLGTPATLEDAITSANRLSLENIAKMNVQFDRELIYV